MKQILAPTESLTVVIDDKEITVTAQQLLGLKQAETTDPDEKYRELRNELDPTWYLKSNGLISEGCISDFQSVPTQLSAQRVRTYIKMLNIAAKLNGEADWNGDEQTFCYFLESEHEHGVITSIGKKSEYKSTNIYFKTRELALEALTYLNSEDKIAMFGTDKVKED
jgi:hypothetical protein